LSPVAAGNQVPALSPVAFVSHGGAKGALAAVTNLQNGMVACAKRTFIDAQPRPMRRPSPRLPAVKTRKHPVATLTQLLIECQLIVMDGY
jgi:hypothetical protein